LIFVKGDPLAGAPDLVRALDRQVAQETKANPVSEPGAALASRACNRVRRTAAARACRSRTGHRRAASPSCRASRETATRWTVRRSGDYNRTSDPL